MDAWVLALNQAAKIAREFEGATSPNPPVGAAALNAAGEILAIAAHTHAGMPHAEAALLDLLERDGRLNQVTTLVVTLEPCNHFGRTPPCSERILKVPSIRQVVFAVHDPHTLASGGAEKLREHGLEVIQLDHAPSTRLSRAFCHKVLSTYPWVTVKTALTADGSMIPPPGQKTFTSEDSLRFAHELRRRADALITGSGTVISDLPEFTIRRVKDMRTTPRQLIVLDRSHKTPSAWIDEQKKRFNLRVCGGTLEELLEDLSASSMLEVLIEAGPKVTESILKSGLWNEQILIRQMRDDSEAGLKDEIEERENVHWHHPKSRNRPEA